MDIKISVIIPVYNMEEYINECIDSVLKQTLQDIEIICVDDGSTDTTGEIIKEYCKTNSKISLIKQKNLGAGVARNEGILKAKGKYVIFMDADDFYPEADILKSLYERAEAVGASICGGSMSLFSEGVIRYAGLRKGYIISEDTVIDSVDYESFSGYQRFLYKRSFLIENNVFFPAYRRCQDAPFFVLAIAKAGKIYCVKKVTYCYRKNHKIVVFDVKKAVDYAKGMRDSLRIAIENNLVCICKNLIKELQGEPAAMIYKYVAEEVDEMQDILRDINTLAIPYKDELGIAMLSVEQAKDFVSKIPQKKKQFLDELSKREKVYLYGAGTIGRKVLNFLRQEKMHADCFLVSNKADNPDRVLGVDVLTPLDVQQYKDEATVVISTFEYLQGEIAEYLRKMDFKYIMFIDLKEFYLFDENINH